MPRFWEIDFARGVAVLMMAIFHFVWDLNYFGFIQGNIYSGFWGLLQKATATLFLLLVGVALSITYYRHKNDYAKRFLKRGIIVFGFGLLITASTFIFFRESFIYFGILQLISASIIFSIPFAGKKYLNFLLGIAVIALPLLYDLRNVGQPLLVWLGFATPQAALDFFPIFPWFGVVLVGLAIGDSLYKDAERKFTIEKPENAVADFLQLIGKNALFVYFIHQAILFPIVYAMAFLF